MPMRRFVVLLLLSVGLSLGLVGGLNRVVDPFWYFRDVEVTGLNAVKTKFRWYERHVKPAIVARERPQALIFGSSYAEIGFDPTNAAFTAGRTLRAYNFAIAGASWQDTFCYVDYALRHAQVKRIVLGVHPGALPIADCTKAQAELEGPGWGELLFSATALKASLSTMVEQRRDSPSHTREGLYFYTRGDPATERHFREGMRSRLSALPNCTLEQAAVLPAAAGPQNAATPIDLSAVEYLIKAARERGIQVELVFYPSHVFALELVAQCGRLPAIWEALRQTAALLDSSAKGAAVRAWEFFGYNEVTGERVGNAMRYWQDPEHFNYEMGDLMLDEMFAERADGGPHRLGRPVSLRELERRLPAFLQERTRFIESHPWFYEQLRALVPRERWRGAEPGAAQAGWRKPGTHHRAGGADEPTGQAVIRARIFASRVRSVGAERG